MIKVEPSSFRDPASNVYHINNNIYRRVKLDTKLNFRIFLNSNFYKKNEDKIIKTRILEQKDLKFLKIPKKLSGNNILWLQHEKILNIIYPYEMCFDQLKDSATFFLEILENSILNSYDLSDATPYNVQFKSNKPIFIDITSFTKLDKNSFFIGYKQFCESYLSPLVLSSFSEINFNDLYRSNLNGMDLKVVSKLLPKYSYFNLNIFTNIHFHAFLNSKIKSTSHQKKLSKRKTLNFNNKLRLIKNLKNFIKKLELKESSYWQDYSKFNSYNSIATSHKKNLVKDFIITNKINRILDLGSNDGTYSQIAYDLNVKEICCVDNDSTALNRVYKRFKHKDIEFNAIYQNFMDPSPDLGWRNNERKSFYRRFKNKFDGLICLAFIHHICIGNNVPLEQFINYITKFSKHILLEFVPKNDPMVKNMIFNKQGLLENYSLENLKEIIKKDNIIKKILPIKNTKRKLIFFERK